MKTSYQLKAYLLKVECLILESGRIDSLYLNFLFKTYNAFLQSIHHDILEEDKEDIYIYRWEEKKKKTSSLLKMNGAGIMSKYHLPSFMAYDNQFIEYALKHSIIL